MYTCSGFNICIFILDTVTPFQIQSNILHIIVLCKEKPCDFPVISSITYYWQILTIFLIQYYFFQFSNEYQGQSFLQMIFSPFDRTWINRFVLLYSNIQWNYQNETVYVWWKLVSFNDFRKRIIKKTLESAKMSKYLMIENRSNVEKSTQIEGKTHNI